MASSFPRSQPGDTMHQYARLTTARARQPRRLLRGAATASRCLSLRLSAGKKRPLAPPRKNRLGGEAHALRQKAGYIYRFADYISEVKMPTGKFPDVAVNGCPRFASIAIFRSDPTSLHSAANCPTQSVVRSSPTCKISPIGTLSFSPPESTYR